MTELEKAQESLKWINMFDHLTDNATLTAINIGNARAKMKHMFSDLRNTTQKIIDEETKKTV